MKPEEFERLKQQEKAHLLEVEKLKARLKEAERLRSIGQALNDVRAAGSTDALDASLERVQFETAAHEARMDMAIDGSADSTSTVDDVARTDEEFAALRAADLVKQMKRSMGALSEPDSASIQESASDKGTTEDEKPVRKTIGRMTGQSE